MYNKKIESVTYTGDDLTTTTWAALLKSATTLRCSDDAHDAPTMLTTLRLPTGPVLGPTSEILVLLTPTEQHAHGRLFLETVWLFLLTSNLVASSFHQPAGRCRPRRISGDETAVPLCTLVPTSSLVRLSAAPNTEFVDLRLYDWCFLPEYQLDLFESPPTCWVSTEAAHPLQRHTWLACRSRVQFVRGIRREVLRGVHQIQLGVSGALWAPSGVRGGVPEDFEINAFQRLRTPVSLSFLSQCCCTKIHAIFFIHSHPHHFQRNEVVDNDTLWYQKCQCQWIAQFWVLFFT